MKYIYSEKYLQIVVNPNIIKLNVLNVHRMYRTYVECTITTDIAPDVPAREKENKIKIELRLRTNQESNPINSSLIATKQDLEKVYMPNSSFPGQYQTIRSLLGSEVLIYASCLYRNYAEYNHYRELKRYTHILNLILPKSTYYSLIIYFFH